MPKKVYTWGKVKPGDIISFRYKGKKATGTLTTLLVLNPRIPYTRKDKTKTFHLIGLKLESRGNIPIIKSKPMLVQLLERIGEVQVIDSSDNAVFNLEHYQTLNPMKDDINFKIHPPYLKLKRKILF